jgi:hypothetical protein
MDELILPPDCKYDLKKHRWVCSGVELVIGSAEDEEHYEEEEYFEDCGSDLIGAELCTENYEELCESDLIGTELCGEEDYEDEDEEYEEDYEEYEDY